MNRREKKRMRGLRDSSTALPGDGESRTHHAQQVVTAPGSVAIFSNQKRTNLNMGYGNRDKPERKSGRVGFVEGRLNELRRRWENATDEREKSELSEQIREWQSFRPERSASSGGGRS